MSIAAADALFSLFGLTRKEPTMNNDLCPFCGTAPRLVETGILDADDAIHLRYYMHCQNKDCDFAGPLSDSIERAEDTWARIAKALANGEHHARPERSERT